MNTMTCCEKEHNFYYDDDYDTEDNDTETYEHMMMTTILKTMIHMMMTTILKTTIQKLMNI